MTSWKKQVVEVGQTVMVRPMCVRRATVISKTDKTVEIEYEDGGVFAGYTDLPKRITVWDYEVEPIVSTESQAS